MLDNDANKIKLKNRIAYKQSRFIVLLAFILGLFFSFTQVYVDYTDQERNLKENIQQVVNIMKRPAAEAAFHLDGELAKQVAGGLFEYSPIMNVRIIGILGSDESSVELIALDRTLPEQHDQWLSEILFGDQQLHNIPLVLIHDDTELQVGILTVGSSPYEAASAFIDRSINGILFGILRTSLLALIVLIFFYYTVTNPLTALSRSWAKIDPEKTSNIRLTLPPKHQKDEFGMLANNANRFLSALEKHLDRRREAEQALILANETLENRVTERTAELQSEITVRVETEQALQTKSEIILLLKKLTVIANEASSFKDAVESTLLSISQSIGWPFGHAYLFLTEENDTFHSSSLCYVKDQDNYKVFSHAFDLFELRYGIGLPGQVQEKKSPIWISDLSLEPYAPGLDLARQLNVKAAFAFPITVNQEVVAILESFSLEALDPNETLIDAMDDIAIQLSRVVERERAAKTLTEAKEEAIAATKAKSVFLATMSHEIRTPMNGVQGMLQVLEQSDLDEEQKETVAVINDSALMLTTIINDILDFSKIEAGQLELEIVAFSPALIFESVITLMSPRAVEKSLDLSLVVSPDIPEFLKGDPVRIRQVLLNLVSNAIKFTSKGQVLIKVSKIDSKITDKKNENPFESAAPDKKVRLLFQVCDTGCGLTANQVSNLFQPFVQADTSISRRFGGTGLGLSICQRLIELLDGDIGVDSQLEKGSRFWFTLDFESAEKSAIVSINPVSTRPPKLKILVVEDNPVNQKVAFNLLTNERHKVICASNGKQALEMLDEIDADVVLMDMHMPEMDGLEATRHIRALDNMKSDIPIIMLSADVLSRSQITSQEAGINHFIAKPFALSQINSALVDLFGERENDTTVIETIESQSEEKNKNTGSIEIYTETINLIDKIALTAIQTSIGYALLKELIEDFNQHCINNFSAMNDAILDNNILEAYDIAHSLKGAARELKGTQFSQLASKIEHAKNIEEIQTILPKLTSCFQATLEAYQQGGYS